MMLDSLRMLAGLAGLAPLGAGTLLALGLWGRFRGVVRAGLVLFTGLAGAVTLLPPLIYAGLAPSVPVVVGIGVAALGAGLALERRRRPDGDAPGAVAAGLPPALAVAVPLAVLAVRAAVKPGGAYDAFTNWGLKAKLIYFSGSPLIEREYFHASFGVNSPGPPVERVYPIGLPSLEAYFLHALGGPNFRALHLLFAALLGVFALTVVALLRPYAGPWLLAAGASLVLWMPAARDQALGQNADIPLACFWISAALLVGIWVRGGENRWLALAALFAAAALATKREGAIYTVILFAVALGAILVSDNRWRWRPLLLAGVFIAASALPWRIYVSSNDLTGHDIAVSPQRIVDHLYELPMIVRHLGKLMVDPIFLGVIPLAVTAAAVLLLREHERRLAGGFLALVAAVLLTLVAVYVNSKPGTRYLLNTTAHRTLVTPALLSAALLPVFFTHLFRLRVPEPSARLLVARRLRPRRLSGALEP